jgi:large subunit ribosomal protein L18e
MTNQVVILMARDLKKASTKNDAPIWAKLAEYALKPSIARRHINLNRIGQLTKDADMVVFPGKVLGGKIISFSDLIKKHPTGKGVVLLG